MASIVFWLGCKGRFLIVLAKIVKDFSIGYYKFMVYITYKTTTNFKYCKKLKNKIKQLRHCYL